MVVAAANLVTKHGIDRSEVDADYFEDHNFLHDERRKNRHEDDIISMTQEVDDDGILKVRQ